MGRTGSIVNVVRAGSFAIDCAGFCTVGVSTLVRTDFFTTFLVFLAGAGAVFAVITCTISPVFPSVRLSPPKVDGASACARAPAMKAIESNAVASAKKIRGLRTSARYAGNHRLWQAFFSKKLPRVAALPRPRHAVASRSGIVSRQENNLTQILAGDRTSGRGQ